MAYINYGQATVGGKQIAEAMANLQAVAQKLQNLADWINEIGPTALDTNTDFQVLTADKQSFNDTFNQIATAYVSFMGDGTPGSNREKIARLARGA